MLPVAVLWSGLGCVGQIAFVAVVVVLHLGRRAFPGGFAVVPLDVSWFWPLHGVTIVGGGCVCVWGVLGWGRAVRWVVLLLSGTCCRRIGLIPFGSNGFVCLVFGFVEVTFGYPADYLRVCVLGA